MRVDVPHLRTLDSSIASDFDDGFGWSLAGNQPLVVSGFVLVTTGAVGALATSLQLQVDPGLVWHPGASEAGTVFRTTPGTAPEPLSSTNAKVLGSFTAGQVNYVGLDLVRSTDATTSDLVEFLDADTLQENPETVPLARTLAYTIVISTQDFVSTPNILPLALVTVASNGTVTAIQDARNLAFRCGTGGTTPSAYSAYTWPQGRNELLNADGFSGGDKAFASLRDAIQAMESRFREVGGGPFWYSAATDRQVKLVGNPGSTFANGTNYKVDGSGHLLWQGLAFLFCNANTLGGAIYQADVADQTSEQVGLTDIQVGECIYVDVDESQSYLKTNTPANPLTPAKAKMASLGVPAAPYTRWVIAWVNAYGYFTRDSQFVVGTGAAGPAGNGTMGTSELNVKPTSSSAPVVVSADASANAIAAGLTRGSGSNPSLSVGVIAIGTGTNDSGVTIGKSTTNITLSSATADIATNRSVFGYVQGLGGGSATSGTTIGNAVATTLFDGTTPSGLNQPHLVFVNFYNSDSASAHTLTSCTVTYVDAASSMSATLILVPASTSIAASNAVSGMALIYAKGSSTITVDAEAAAGVTTITGTAVVLAY